MTLLSTLMNAAKWALPSKRRTSTSSDANFTPHGSAIRFGLAAVKNVGHNAIESIMAGRKELGRYSSIYEFCEKVDLRLLNKRVLESLIKSGAMDWTGPPRPADGGSRSRHRRRAEDPARCRKRPARPVRRISAGGNLGLTEPIARHPRLG